jgi:hypothetical protein
MGYPALSCSKYRHLGLLSRGICVNELGRLEKCVCCATEHNILPKQATHKKNSKDGLDSSFCSSFPFPFKMYLRPISGGCQGVPSGRDVPKYCVFVCVFPCRSLSPSLILCPRGVRRRLANRSCRLVLDGVGHTTTRDVYILAMKCPRGNARQ